MVVKIYFYILIDLESFQPYLPTLFYDTDTLAIIDNYNFCDTRKYTQKDGHGDSMTDPAQRAESGNVFKDIKCIVLLRKLSKITPNKIELIQCYSVLFKVIKMFQNLLNPAKRLKMRESH